MPTIAYTNDEGQALPYEYNVVNLSNGSKEEEMKIIFTTKHIKTQYQMEKTNTLTTNMINMIVTRKNKKILI